MIPAAFLMLFTTLILQGAEYSIKGKVSDTSDNWLNNATVTSEKLQTKTATDPNGNFELNLNISATVKPDAKGNIAYIKFSAEDHITQTISIKNIEFFTKNKALSIKLEPISLKGDVIGFKTKMPTVNVVGLYLHKLKAKTGYGSASTNIPLEAFEKAFKDETTYGDKNKTSDAEFHVYIPKSVKKVKAAFFISRHGMGNLTSPVLRKFAEKEKVALVGFLGNPTQRGLFPVSLLDPFIEKLAKLAKHPELTEVPILTFGHSNGTGFSACYASERPEKVIAWISYHSGYSNYLQFPNTENVPSLVMHGRLDGWLKHKQDETVQNMRKYRNAAMCMMMEGNVGHGPVNKETTWEFIVEFCTAAMKARLSEGNTLKPVDINSGWLGAIYDPKGENQQNLDIAEYSKFKGDKTTANWLFDEKFAKVWQAYGNKKPDRKDKPSYLKE